MKTPNRLLALFSTIAIMMVAAPASAKVWIVNNAGPGDYTTAQAAHDAAATGDTLYIVGSAAGYGDLNVSKRLTLIGPGYFLEENENTSANNASAIFSSISFLPDTPLNAPARDLESGSSGSTIIGMAVPCCGAINVYVHNITIQRCFMTHLYTYAFESHPISGLHVSQCTLVDASSGDIRGSIENSIIENSIIGQFYQLTTATTLVKNCSFTYTAGPSSANLSTAFLNCIFGSGQNAEILAGQDANNVRHCLFQFANPDPSGSNPSYTAGISNIFEYSPTLMYISPVPASYDAKFQLGSSSPATTAGEDGVDAGAFGGDHPYVLSGLPPIPTVYEITAPNSVNQSEGLNVTIKVRSNN